MSGRTSTANVVELDPGLREFMQSKRGREVKKLGDLALVIDDARRARREGRFRSKAGVQDAWKIQALALDFARNCARGSPDQFRVPALPKYTEPAHVIVLGVRTAATRTAGAP